MTMAAASGGGGGGGGDSDGVEVGWRGWLARAASVAAIASQLRCVHSGRQTTPETCCFHHLQLEHVHL